MKRIILTGERNRGKTSFCRFLVSEARDRGLSTAGILSLKEIKDNKVAALWAADCLEKEKRKLARFIPESERPSRQRENSKTPSWQFYPETFIWGNELIRQTPPADLFILDEAGPLEFDPDPSSRGEKGAWTAGMERMDGEIDGIALVVVRPELVERALEQWPEALVIDAPGFNESGELINTIKEIIIG